MTSRPSPHGAIVSLTASLTLWALIIKGLEVLWTIFGLGAAFAAIIAGLFL